MQKKYNLSPLTHRLIFIKSAVCPWNKRPALSLAQYTNLFVGNLLPHSHYTWFLHANVGAHYTRNDTFYQRLPTTHGWAWTANICQLRRAEANCQQTTNRCQSPLGSSYWQSLGRINRFWASTFCQLRRIDWWCTQPRLKINTHSG